MNIFVQRIGVTWTKASRGAPAAKLRNAVPETYPIKLDDLDDGMYLQEVQYSEFDNFVNARLSKVKKINENQLREIQLAFNFIDEQKINVFSFGIPGRQSYSKEKRIGQLTKNNWIKIVGNSRVSWEYTWAYYKYVYNIFYGEPHKFNEIIKSVEPINIYKDEVHLF